MTAVSARAAFAHNTARRALDALAWLLLPRSRPAAELEAVDPVTAGHVLLIAAGAAVLGAAPLLSPTRAGWTALIVVSAVMATALLVSARLDWRRAPDRATLVFPFLVCAALLAVASVQPGLTAPLLGVVTLCFAYVGISQPPWSSPLLLPVALATLVVSYGGLNGQVTVRLVIGLGVWTLLTELLAWLRTRQTALAASLSGAAAIDALTGVANRRDFDVRLAVLRPGDSVVVCDLDHFKLINDTLGHSFGDRVLIEFGSVLRATLRGNDYCARYGGEEFVLLLGATSHGQAQTMLARLRDHWSTLQPAVTFSAGIATHLTQRSTQATLDAADAALYSAKHDGRNTTRVEQPIT